jgi:uncharacterized protein HemX
MAEQTQTQNMSAAPAATTTATPAASAAASATAKPATPAKPAAPAASATPTKPSDTSAGKANPVEGEKKKMSGGIKALIWILVVLIVGAGMWFWLFP